jgi:hypothetical protein
MVQEHLPIPQICHVLALTAGVVSQASPNLTPDFEVKFLLDSTVVLNPEHELSDELLSAFAMPPTVTKINVMFLDTDNKALYQARWIARIRKTEGKRSFELTYKTRYPIEGEDIGAALTVANGDGFSVSNDNKYEAQVEWGYEKMTLSISHDKKASDSGFSGTSLPGFEAARGMLADEAPEKFNNAGGENWGKNVLQAARIYGPILTTRSVGKWKGIKITVEVWPIVIAAEGRTEYIVEASFKADTETEARDGRRAVQDMLSGMGWLSPRDSLKTQLVLDNY